MQFLLPKCLLFFASHICEGVEMLQVYLLQK